MSTKYLFEQAGFSLKVPSDITLNKVNINNKPMFIIWNEKDFASLLKNNRFDINDIKLSVIKSSTINLKDYKLVIINNKTDNKINTFVDKLLLKYEKDSGEINKKITDINKQIYSLNNCLDNYKVKLIDIKSSIVNTRQISSQIEKISKLKDIIDISISKSYLQLFTNDIIVKNDEIDMENDKINKKYNIGKLVIKISLDEYYNSNSIIIAHTKDLNFIKVKLVAPHVNEDGVACFGNISSTIKRLFNSKDYLSLCSVILSFLKSYTDSEGYNPYGGLETKDERNYFYQCKEIK